MCFFFGFFQGFTVCLGLSSRLETLQFAENMFKTWFKDVQGDFGTVLGKRKNAIRRGNINVLGMLTVCKKHAPKQHSELQSRMEVHGFRANVSPLANYTAYLNINIGKFPRTNHDSSEVT